ncbi:midasin-like [Amblyraja radiata]|uniref:midasin-like n=1 Tax=Amblyraja radiata TaxID=386614 RepID=UPI0014023C55|nr:midasin-like [Amblyraja radiata]
MPRKCSTRCVPRVSVQRRGPHVAGGGGGGLTDSSSPSLSLSTGSSSSPQSANTMGDQALQLAALPLVAKLNERSRSELSKYLAKQIWNKQDRQYILNVLAQLLLIKECTLLIGRHLRPLLLDLLERNVNAIKGPVFNHDLHERLCVAMSKLIDISPDAIL